ncbi:MAG: DUF6090 family protein [Bacteroidota bacterium]
MSSLLKKHGPRLILELLVIIVGILLSVYITNLFENAKESRKEQIFLKQLQQDLQDDLTSLRSDSTIRSEQYHNVERMTAYVGGFDANIPTSVMAQGIPSLLSPIRHTPTDATFRVLESTGTLSLLQDEELLRSITRLYANTYADLAIADQNIENFRTNFLLPFALEQFNFLESFRNPEFLPEMDLDAIVNLENQMIYASLSYRSSVNMYENALKEVRALIEQIESQLK